MSNLDDLNSMHEIDIDLMLSHIDAMPDQLQNAWNAAQQMPLPESYLTPKQIVLCGMGGSAIGGDLVAALTAETSPIPFSVLRNYDLPAYVTGPDTLVIASSNSGNTEETLHAAAQAHERGTKVLVVSTGGKLAEFATEHGYPLWKFDYKSQPRAALGWSFGLLVGLAHRMALAPGLDADVAEATALLREMQPAYTAGSPESSNVAKQNARKLIGRVPVFFGSGIFEPVARRWKGQLNENSKVWAQYESVPEMNHNAVASVTFPSDQDIPFAAMFIVSEAFDHPRVGLRYELTMQMCADNGFVTDAFQPQGKSALAQMCHAIQYGDYLSFYVAMIYGKDPTAIEQIMMLKAQLSQR